jgi:hypothetical protein
MGPVGAKALGNEQASSKTMNFGGHHQFQQQSQRDLEKKQIMTTERLVALRETGADREPDAIPPGRPGCGTATNAFRRTATFEGPQPVRPHPPPQAFHDDHRFTDEEGKQVAACASSPSGAPHRPFRIPSIRCLCRGLALPSGGRRGLDGSAGLAPPMPCNFTTSLCVLVRLLLSLTISIILGPIVMLLSRSEGRTIP